ncbi:hypothetical protein LZG04_16230 [Saccharothrix sp. S26]|uniref:prenyltransferase/squalene oxidase repeat-containing protein n=1 Tax=Saccharothrix sp. S26 TaxID=2907215 RepID=UPI001F1F1561|nr:prenyltransferase/squalene oxidase repeat-containing protein [Saccharothrix sp. S26]MCE6996333.1 hypothetical protein [Saccharothrix sp. S26]
MPNTFSERVRDFLDTAFTASGADGHASAVDHTGRHVLTSERTLGAHATIALADLAAHPDRAAASLAALLDFADPRHEGFVEVEEISGIPHELGNVKTSEAQLLAVVAALSADPQVHGPRPAEVGGRVLDWLDRTLRDDRGCYLAAVSRDGAKLLDDAVTALSQSLGLWATALAVRHGLRSTDDLRQRVELVSDVLCSIEGVVPSRVRPDGTPALEAKVEGTSSAITAIALAEAATVLGDDTVAQRAREVFAFLEAHLWDSRFDGYWDHCDLDGRITVHREFITLLNAAIPIKTSRTNAWLVIAAAAVHGAGHDTVGRAARYLRTLHDDAHGGVFIGEGYFWTPPGNPVGPFERLMLPSRRTAGISYFGASSFLRLYNKFPESQALASWAFQVAGDVVTEALPQAAPAGSPSLPTADVPRADLVATRIADLPPVDLTSVMDRERHLAVIGAAYTPHYGFGWTHRRSPLGSQPDRTPSVFGTHHSIANLKVLGGEVPDPDGVADWLRSTQSPLGMFGEYPGGPSDVLNTYLAINALDLLGVDDFGDREACVAHLRACQNQDGGFGVVPGFISDLFHTNLAVVALHTLKAEPRDIDACVDYLLRSRTGDGGYGQRVGTPADVYSIYRAAGTLALFGLALPDRDDAVRWLRDAQGPGGGFRHDLSSRESLIATYHAVAALFILGGEPADREAVVRWLQTCQTAEGTFSNIPGVSSGTIDEAFAAVQSLAILAGGLDPYFAILVS